MAKLTDEQIEELAVESLLECKDLDFPIAMAEETLEAKLIAAGVNLTVEEIRDIIDLAP